MLISCCYRGDLTSLKVKASALTSQPRALTCPDLQADRRTFLLGWAACLLTPQLALSMPQSSSSLPATPQAPLYSLAYLDPEICISAAYPADFYLQKMRVSFQLARQQLGDLLEQEAYSALSNSLVLDSFNDLRQAAFYLPCALAHTSSNLASEAQLKYNQFLKQCRGLDKISRAAGNARADQSDVEDAMSLVWQAADQMLQLHQ